MTSTLTRRRFLAIAAAGGLCTAAGAATGPMAQWRGYALGAPASMKLVGLEETEARSVFRAVELELARLERIFSLYRTDSELVRLNTAGVLRNPAPEMLELLSLCARLHDATGGVFDPTLQPLWRLLATQGDAASPREIADARALIGWNAVMVSRESIRFDRPGMALTLNGVAQGYVTDRIKALLIARGLTDVLIDIGEVAALGTRPDGADWTVGIAMPDGRIVDRVTLRDRALATSSPGGTMLVPGQGLGHILDPRGTEGGPSHELVTISAPQAAVADGLSTAGCLLSSMELRQAIGSFAHTALESTI